MRTLAHDSGPSGHLAFAPCGRWLYGLFGQSVVGWDLAADTARPAWAAASGGDGLGYDLVVSPCGRWLIEVSHWMIAAFDLAAGRRHHRLWPGNTRWNLGDAVFSPGGAELFALASGAGRGSPWWVCGWRVGGWDESSPWPCAPSLDAPQSVHTGRLAVHPDGTRLATEYRTPAVCYGLAVWDRDTGARLAGRQVAGSSAGRLRYTADGLGLLSDCFSEVIRYDAATLARTAEFAADAGDSFCELAVQPAGRLAAVGMGDRVVLLDATSLRPEAVYDFGLGPMVRVAFAPDGSTAAACGESGKVVLFDLD